MTQTRLIPLQIRLIPDAQTWTIPTLVDGPTPTNPESGAIVSTTRDDQEPPLQVVT